MPPNVRVQQRYSVCWNALLGVCLIWVIDMRLGPRLVIGQPNGLCGAYVAPEGSTLDSFILIHHESSTGQDASDKLIVDSTTAQIAFDLLFENFRRVNGS